MPRKVAAEQLSLELCTMQSLALDEPDEPRCDAERDSRVGRVEPEPRRAVPTRSRRRHDVVKHRPPTAELLGVPGALLTRSDLRELGLERRAIDAVFRALPVVAFPGYSRPMIRADAYYALIDASTYRDDRVRARNA